MTAVGRGFELPGPLLLTAILAFAVACAGRFPPICVAASSVRIDRVQWVTADQMRVIYTPPYTKFSRWVGAVVTQTPERVEIRVMERYGRGEHLGRQVVEVTNPLRLPVVITDDVEEFVVWSQSR